MILTDIYNAIIEGKELRQNILKLKEELNSSVALSSFRYMLGGDYSGLVKHLKDEDPKNRKNIALILGELKDSSLVDELFEAYRSESQLFVRSSYLKAISNLNYSGVLEQLKARRCEINDTNWEEEQLKHIREELSVLNRMIGAYDKEKKHIFVGYQKSFDVILTTNAVDILADNFKSCRKLKSGVRLNGVIEELMNIRIYNELLFVINDLQTIDENPIQAAKELADGNIMDVLKQAHNGEFQYKFRVELRGEKESDKERKFVKAFAKELERISVGELVNSTTDYEIEIRLIKNKESRYLPLLKLKTLKDKRFAYRREVLPVSIHPVNAAVVMKYIEKYLKKDARVLDPFCGVGTMLLERKYIGSVDTLYGIDKYGKAIDMARENSAVAGIIVHYINKDYFEFTHEYAFDEIITNMPAVTQKYTESDIAVLYEHFFEKSAELLKSGSYIFMVSNEKRMIQRNVDSKKDYKLIEEFCISKKDEKFVFVIRRS